MFPSRSEKLLQDTKSAQDYPVSRRNNTIILIVILFLLLLIGLAYGRFAHPFSSYVPVPSAATIPSPAKISLTHTFLDSIFATYVFVREGSLYVVNLPDRGEHPIIGVADTSQVSIDVSYAPVWSPDGKLLAVVTKEKKVVVTEFDTGKYVGSFPLPSDAIATSTMISIDPANEVIAFAKQAVDSKSESIIQFYSLLTQKELGVYPRCESGVWMRGIGYATMCQVADSRSIAVIRFEPSSSVMTPLTRESASTKYQIIDEYTAGTLLLARTVGARKDLVTLDASGRIAAVPTKEYKAVPNVDDIIHAEDALKRRIERETHISSVTDVSVAKDNSFVLFQTQEGLYAAKLDLKDKPYFLGKGTMPRIRPE